MAVSGHPFDPYAEVLLVAKQVDSLAAFLKDTSEPDLARDRNLSLTGDEDGNLTLGWDHRGRHLDIVAGPARHRGAQKLSPDELAAYPDQPTSGCVPNKPRGSGRSSRSALIRSASSETPCRVRRKEGAHPPPGAEGCAWRPRPRSCTRWPVRGEQHPDRLPRSIRALGAAGGFITGFFKQLVTLTGPDELDDGWFRRGEWAAILFVVALAAAGLVLLITAT